MLHKTAIVVVNIKFYSVIMMALKAYHQHKRVVIFAKMLCKTVQVVTNIKFYTLMTTLR